MKSWQQNTPVPPANEITPGFVVLNGCTIDGNCGQVLLSFFTIFDRIISDMR